MFHPNISSTGGIGWDLLARWSTDLSLRDALKLFADVIEVYFFGYTDYYNTYICMPVFSLRLH